MDLSRKTVRVIHATLRAMLNAAPRRGRLGPSSWVAHARRGSNHLSLEAWGKPDEAAKYRVPLPATEAVGE